MNHDDERDYSEEAANQAEMETPDADANVDRLRATLAGSAPVALAADPLKPNLSAVRKS